MAHLYQQKHMHIKGLSQNELCSCCKADCCRAQMLSTPKKFKVTVVVEVYLAELFLFLEETLPVVMVASQLSTLF